MVKRCVFCGRYFTPDPRVKERQKACSRPECKKARKHLAQKKWSEKNPGYFRGRSPYVKAWREKKKGLIQDKIPREERPQKLVFVIPASMMPMLQDKIVMKRSGKRTFMADGRTEGRYKTRWTGSGPLR